MANFTRARAMMAMELNFDIVTNCRDDAMILV